MAEAKIEELTDDETLAILGSRDENLRLLREKLGLKMVVHEGTLTILGPPEQLAIGVQMVEKLRQSFRQDKLVGSGEIRRWLDGDDDADEPAASPVTVGGPLKSVRARTDGQRRYVQAIRDHDLTFCVGPAGTGKTYLAVAAALEYLHARMMKRIILVRPAVEAGEKLGFLPGDLEAKVNPYLRPLLDALRDMLDFQKVREYLNEDIVEIAPLAYMRGRTLNEAFIILDEAQNTTVPQMQMFLTRMGDGSKIVVTGDTTQLDLPPGTRSGLKDAVNRLAKIDGVAMARMRGQDIVRHPLVQKIVVAYEDRGKA